MNEGFDRVGMHGQRPQLSPADGAGRRRLRRRLGARLYRARGRGRRARRSSRKVLTSGTDAARRLRGAELHQPEQPVDRHRRAAEGARHLRQLLLRPRRRRRSDDERPEVPARRHASSRRSRRPAQAIAVITAKDKLRGLLGKGLSSGRARRAASRPRRRTRSRSRKTASRTCSPWSASRCRASTARS